MNSTAAPVFDAAVVGGGPAGFSAAISLARQGYRVRLFERHTYPHDKLCGEFLSPECIGLLRHLSVLPRLEVFLPPTIHRARISAPSGASWEARLPGTALGMSRMVFDAALADEARAAGVDLLEGTEVIQISGDLQSGFLLEARQPSRRVKFRARTVIAAYGKRAALDRALGRRFLEHPAPFMALKAHFHGPPVPDRVELHTFRGGYCGFSEIENDGRDVCLLTGTDVFRKGSAGGEDPIETFIGWMQTQNPLLAEWLGQAERTSPKWISIAQVPFMPKRAVVNGILMAGDAAGLIVPLAGDGIAMALEGGLMASACVQAFLKEELSAQGLVEEYRRAWNRRFAGRLRTGRFIQRLMLEPNAIGPALRVMRALPPLGQFLVAQTRSMQPLELGR